MIAVTGATGLVGSHLCKKLLSEGHQVLGLIHNRKNALTETLLDNPNFNTCYVDMKDRGSIRLALLSHDIKTVFHTAAVLPVTKRQDYLGINTMGTANLLYESQKQCIKDFIYTSSISVYSTPPEYIPVDEEHPTDPDDEYGISKRQAEGLCNAYVNLMNIYIIRLAGVYGIGDSHSVVLAFFKASMRGRHLTIHSGGQSSEIVHADDAVQGIYLAWESKKAGIYNIGSGEESNIADLANYIQDITKSTSSVLQSTEKSPRPFRFYTDINKAREEIGYNPISHRSRLVQHYNDIKGSK